jgi:hypothetical protein
VVGFFNLSDKSYDEELCNKHANDATNLMTADASDAMSAALCDLGIKLNQVEAARAF